MISRIRRALSSFWSPRKRASEQHRTLDKAITQPVEKHLPAQEPLAAASVEQDTPGLDLILASSSPTFNPLNSSEVEEPQIPPSLTSTPSKKAEADVTNYLPPSVEDATDEDLGSPFQLLTPPTSKPKNKKKKRDFDPAYFPLKEDFSDKDLDGPTLVENELSCRRGSTRCIGPTRKRKRVSDRDPTFSLSSEPQDSTDSDLEWDTLVDNSKNKRKRKTKSNGDSIMLRKDEHSEGHSNVPNTPAGSRFIDSQSGGTLLERDSEWSEAESGTGSVRHHTPASQSGHIISRVPSMGSTPSKKCRKSDSRDDPYLPPRDIVNRQLRKSIVAPDAVESNLSDEEEWTEDPVWKHDKNEVASDFSIEKAKRWAEAVKLPNGQWAEAEQDLFFRLAMRGFEPLVPNNWHLDFPTLPDTLFAIRDGQSEPLIQALSDREFRGRLFFPGVEISRVAYLLTRRNSAIKSLNDLFSLGSRVRDRRSTPLRPEPIIKRTVKKYLDWALRDANMHNRPNAIPVYHIYAMRKGESTRAALDTLNRRLISLAKRYRDALRLTPSIENPENEANDEKETQAQYVSQRKFPVLTGFLICGPIIAVTTLDSDPNTYPDLDSGVSCKFIAQFDVCENGQDVWNAFAIAITVMRIRKTMIELEEEGKGEWMWMIDDHCPQDDTDEDL